MSRRAVLKASGVGVGVMALGGSPFVGSAFANHVAGHPASDYDLYGIDHMSSPNKLVMVDSLDLVPGAGTITVDSIDLVGGPVDVNTLAAHPFEEGGARWFYSTDLRTNRAFRVHPTTGQVEFIGTANPVLGGIAGSAIVVDENDDPRWYGITHAGASPASTLFEIDLTDGSTTNIGGLHVDDNGTTTPVVATHLGMGVNFLTDELWGVLGDPSDDTNSRVFRVIDVETGEIEIVDPTAMTGGRSVGAALGPCANVMYAVRQGNQLFGYDVSTQDEYAYGSLAYETGSLDFDGLAVPYGFACEDCVECDADGLVAKFEFEWDEDSETYTFLLEEGSDEFVSFDEFTSKLGEENEPMTATFGTEYCDLYALVKSGQEFEVQSFEDVDGSVVVETANDERFAISFVAFYCTEEAAEAAEESFPSRGRGGRPN